MLYIMCLEEEAREGGNGNVLFSQADGKRWSITNIDSTNTMKSSLETLAKAIIEKDTEREVQIASQGRQIDKVLGMVLQWMVPLLQAE